MNFQLVFCIKQDPGESTPYWGTEGICMIDPGKGRTFFSRPNISKISNLHHDLVYFCGDETIVPVARRRFK